MVGVTSGSSSSTIGVVGGCSVVVEVVISSTAMLGRGVGVGIGVGVDSSDSSHKGEEFVGRVEGSTGAG